MSFFVNCFDQITIWLGCFDAPFLEPLVAADPEDLVMPFRDFHYQKKTLAQLAL